MAAVAPQLMVCERKGCSNPCAERHAVLLDGGGVEPLVMVFCSSACCFLAGINFEVTGDQVRREELVSSLPVVLVRGRR
jgi:hypothetical protein